MRVMDQYEQEEDAMPQAQPAEEQVVRESEEELVAWKQLAQEKESKHNL